jgi:outer membrane protein
VTKHHVFVLACTLVFGSGILVAQTQKIGYVNSAKIFQELPEAQAAQRRIDGLTKPIQDSLDAMIRDYQGRIEEYQKKESMMTDAAKRQEQQRIGELERKITEYRQEKAGPEGQLARETQKLLEPIREKIKAAIAAVAREQKYQFIFDRTESVQILLYGDPQHDLTYTVIDRLKRGTK